MYPIYFNRIRPYCTPRESKMKYTDVYIFRVDISAVFIKRFRPFTVLFLYMLIKGKRTLYSKTSEALTPWAEVLIAHTSGGQLPL